MRLLHRDHPWENGAHAELRGVAAVNAGEQRRDETVDGFLAEVAAGHVGDGFIFGAGLGRKEIFARHAQFGGPGEEAREGRWEKFGRDHEHQAVGQRDEAVLHNDVGFAFAVVRREKLVGDAQFAAERSGGGFLGEKGIGPTFDDAAIDNLGVDDAAETSGCFIKGVFDWLAGATGFLEGPGGAHARDASADDGDSSIARPRRSAQDDVPTHEWATSS